MMSIVFKRVETESDAEILRVIRNSCKDFMTRDCSYISPEQQQRWFKNLPNTMDLFLLYNIQHGVIVDPIGYGLIRKEPTEYLISGGLLPDARGKGFGSILFEMLLENVGSDLPIKLEVLKSNIKAFVIYNKLGFIVTHDDGNIIMMEYNKLNSSI
jgi:ribosomal protein S18 acetylase RimI-like enzyme